MSHAADASNRARLSQALALLTDRIDAEARQRRQEQQNADLLKQSLDTQSNWVREALAELTRLNDLTVANEARALEAETALSDVRVELTAVLARQQAWLDEDARGLYAALQTVQSLSSRGVPVFVRADGRPAFRPASGARGARVAVVSAPKAGTYLVAECLKAIGFQDSGVHAATWGLADLRWGPRADLLARLNNLNVTVPLADYIGLVRPGDFVVSHLPPTPEVCDQLAGFRKIALVREARAAFVSFMRYAVSHRLVADAEILAEMGEPARMAAFARSQSAAAFFELSRPIADWTGEDVLRLRFEDLTGPDAAEQARRIAAHVLAEGEPPADIDMTAILGAETLTASGQATRYDTWWSDEAEAAFVAHGGPEVNRAFGYEP